MAQNRERLKDRSYLQKIMKLGQTNGFELVGIEVSSFVFQLDFASTKTVFALSDNIARWMTPVRLGLLKVLNVIKEFRIWRSAVG